MGPRGAGMRTRTTRRRARGLEFLARRPRAERAADARRQPRIAAKLAYDSVTQRERLAAPAQRLRHVEQRQLRHATLPLVGIVAGPEIEVSDAVRVQRGHGALDDQKAGRA